MSYIGEPLYVVEFENIGNLTFFHDKEHAATYLLECYFDEFEVESEEDVIAINNSVADNDMIDDYGWIREEYFED